MIKEKSDFKNCENWYEIVHCRVLMSMERLHERLQMLILPAIMSIFAVITSVRPIPRIITFHIMSTLICLELMIMLMQVHLNTLVHKIEKAENSDKEMKYGGIYKIQGFHEDLHSYKIMYLSGIIYMISSLIQFNSGQEWHGGFYLGARLVSGILSCCAIILMWSLWISEPGEFIKRDIMISNDIGSTIYAGLTGCPSLKTCIPPVGVLYLPIDNSPIWEKREETTEDTDSLEFLAKRKILSKRLQKRTGVNISTFDWNNYVELYSHPSYVLSFVTFNGLKNQQRLKNVINAITGTMGKYGFSFEPDVKGNPECLRVVLSESIMHARRVIQPTQKDLTFIVIHSIYRYCLSRNTNVDYAWVCATNEHELSIMSEYAAFIYHHGEDGVINNRSSFEDIDYVESNYGEVISVNTRRKDWRELANDMIDVDSSIRERKKELHIVD